MLPGRRRTAWAKRDRRCRVYWALSSSAAQGSPGTNGGRFSKGKPMAASLYDLSVPTFLQTVKAVGGFLDRAARHCVETRASAQASTLREQPAQSRRAERSTVGCRDFYFVVQASNPIGWRSIRGSIHPARAVIQLQIPEIRVPRGTHESP